LRRTGGRLMWLAGVPIETIASIMGHESTDMTLQYIGVNLTDQTKAFEAVRNLYVQLQKTPKIVPF
jgi:integrase